MKRIIKKYPNRRLYDTEINAYITLSDIKDLVVMNIDIQIIDAKTKKDLTQPTLLQIIAENETSATPIFTTPMLQNFIRHYHEKSQNLVTRYLEDAMHLYEKQNQLFNNHLQAYQQQASEIRTLWLGVPTTSKSPKKRAKTTKRKTERNK